MKITDFTMDKVPPRWLFLKTNPSLDVEINEKLVKKAAEKVTTWENQVWRNYDGTVAE